MKNEKGFTLIEFLIIIAICGILGAISYGRFGYFKVDQETTKLSMLDYAKNLRPDIVEWNEPNCVTRDTDGDGYVSCSVTGINTDSEVVVLHADCAGGIMSWGNEGCKTKIVVYPQYN